MQSEYSEGWCEMTLEPICHLFWQTDCSRGTFKVLTISFKVSDFESRPCIAQCHYEGTLYLSYRLFLIIRLGLFSTYAIFGRAYFWVMLIFEPCLFSKVTRKWRHFYWNHLPKEHVQKLTKTWIYLSPYVCNERIFDSRPFMYNKIFSKKLR